MDSLNRDLDEASDQAYNVKRKGRRAIQAHIEKSSENEIKMQNYIDSLTDKNKKASSEMSAVLKQKCNAINQSQRAQALAASRLQKWHDERNKRRQLQDDLVVQQKNAKATDAVMQKYKAIVEGASEVKQKEMKK